MSRAVVTLLFWAMLPLTAHAHPFDNPQAVMVLEGEQSNIYTVSASQLATAEQTHVDVQVTIGDNPLPGDIRLVVMATAPDTEPFSAPMERDENTFGANLPTSVDWDVIVWVYGRGGEGSAAFSVTAYRETPPLVRYLTFMMPAIIMLGAIVVFRWQKIDLSNYE